MLGEALKGHLDLLLLAILSEGPAHGYAVIESLRQRSGNLFDLPEGTIYPASTGWRIRVCCAVIGRKTRCVANGFIS